MKYFSLFSGMGGFELGIQRAYKELENNSNACIKEEKTKGKFFAKGKSIKSKNSKGSVFSQKSTSLVCIGYSEIDKYAIQIYQKHFPEHKNYGDATRIIPEAMPDFDLLTAGFPCQSFSIAGKRRGFGDASGTLFFEICRITRIKRPRLLLLENVKGLLSHDKGRTFLFILQSLDELGYDFQWQVLNSKNFGVPQNRERVFIIGNLRGIPRPKVFPITGSDEQDIRKIGEEVSFAIDSNYYKGINTGSEGGRSSFDKMKRQMIEITKNVSDAQRIYSPNGIAKTLKGLGGGLGAKTGMYQMGNLQVRRLTPVECERLQGFPDRWTEGISDTQRYKCLGNAVTVNVIEAIVERLAQEILK